MGEVQFELELRVLVRRLLEFKEEHDLTYREFADLVGVDKSYLNKIAHMKMYPSFTVVDKLAKVMKLPWSVLFMPSAKEELQDYAELVHKHLGELNWTVEELQKKVAISELRLMDITQGNAMATPEEREVLAEVLGLPESLGYRELRLNMLKRVLGDLGLQDRQIENVVMYIEGNG